MTLKVNIPALVSDADQWSSVAVVMKAAAMVAEELVLDDFALGSMSRQFGLTAKYEGIRSKVEGLLGEATQNYDSLASTLLQVATAFESDDKAAAARLRGVWDPK